VLLPHRKVGLVASLGVWAILLAGCPKSSPQPKVGPETRPAPTTRPVTSRPTTKPAVKPLPRTALLTLEQLTPKIAKPVNPKGAKDVPPRAATAVSEAEVALGRREYMAAITRLERAIGFAPGNARMHRALGMAYAGLLNRGKALSNLRKAAAGAPDDLEVQVLLGKLAVAQKQYAAAVMSFRTALKCSEADQANPLVGEVLFRLGDALAEQGYHTAALECFKELGQNIEKHGREYASHPPLRPIVLKTELLLTRRGELLLALRKPARAADLLAKSRKRDRTSVRTARLLLQALIAAKDVPGAEAVFHDLAAEANMKGVVGGLAGELCEASGDKALPLKLWRGQKARGQYDGPLAVALAGAALKLGADDDAMTILRELLAVVPDDVAAGRALVTLQARRGKGDVALRVLANLLASGQSGLAGARAGLAELAGAKLPDDFERTFAAGIKADKPTQRAALYYAAGELARLRGKTELATDLLNKALATKTDFLPALESLADVYVAQRRFDKVDALLRTLSGPSPDEYRVAVIRGKLQLARGLVRKAIIDFEKARALNDRDVDLLVLLADAHWQTEEGRQALDVLRGAQRKAPTRADVYRMQFAILVEVAQGDERIVSLARDVVRTFATKVRPADAMELQLMQAELALVEKKYIEAKRLIAKLQSAYASDRRVRMLVVRLKVDSQWDGLDQPQRDAVIRKARAFVVSRPDDVEATRLLVSALAKAGKTAEIPSIWQLLHRKRPGDMRIASTYSHELVKVKKYSQAADALAPVVEADPTNTYRLDRLIRLLALGKRVGEAIAWTEKALKRPLSAEKKRDFRITLLGLLEESKAFAKAQKLLDDMILTTGEERALASLRAQKIRLYGLAHDLDAARKYALGWIKQEPDSIVPRLMLISALSEAKQWDQATALVDGWLKARAGAGDDDKILPWCRQTAVRMLMRANKYAAALKRAEGFLKITPEDYELLALKSNCLTDLGRHKDALATMEQAYDNTPDDEKVLVSNNLAYIYAEAGVKLAKAENLVRKALNVPRPEGAKPPMAYQDTLAWIFYKQGKIDAAVRTFQQVLKRDDLETESHPVIFDHAGDAFYRAGKAERAVELWTRAVAEAKKDTAPNAEVRNVLTAAAKKIQAVRDGKPAPVAPLGKGVKAEGDKAPAKPAPSSAAGGDEPKDDPAPRERA